MFGAITPIFPCNATGQPFGEPQIDPVRAPRHVPVNEDERPGRPSLLVRQPSPTLTGNSTELIVLLAMDPAAQADTSAALSS
jgi:hypothetical protein